MLFHTPAFIVGFLPLALAGFALAGPWRLLWLAGLSVCFYGWWNPAHVPLLLGSIIANHWLGRCIYHGVHRGRWLLIGVAGNLGLLAWFKYADFLFGSHLGITLPLAISFFTFQQIMYLFACRDQPPPRLTHYAAFVAFFPHLIAGPLVRPGDIIPQLAAARVTADNIATGLTLFLLGLAKKLVLADLFGGFADVGFDATARGEALTLIEAWAATLSYALQIYFDFSAYSDMATGLARLFGVRFPLNFNSPYQAHDIADFWRRWHITLGLFLRDFVYIPLGGNRLGLPREVINLLATMLLAGLWHGAAWRFVLWGGLHGLMLAGHTLFKRSGFRLPGRAAQALTLLLVCLAWVPFRADSMAATRLMLEGLTGLNGLAMPAMIVGWVPGLSAVATSVPLLPFLGDARTLSLPEVTACLLLGWSIALFFPHAQALSDQARLWAVTASAAFTIRALCFAPQVAPFLYFQF